MLMTVVESVAVVLAVVYLVLAVRQNIWCWPAALVSVALSLVLFWDARLLMESALQVFYFAMGVYGWREWRVGGESGTGVRVHWWTSRQHGLALGTIVVLSAVFGTLLTPTSAALPYADSFTTVGAIVTTFMVARKVIENWIYWFVIDSVSIYLYLNRGLWLYAGLFVVYLVLIVIGFRAWLDDAREPVAADA
jgi:nicotinamide mononucleotide transporter